MEHFYLIGRRVLPVFLIMAIGLLIYSNSLNGEFQFDDAGFIRDNFSIRDITKPDLIWQSNSQSTRFIGFYSFALNYYFHNTQVFGYHLTNVIIHIINALLVYWLMQLLFRTSKLKKYSQTYHVDHFSLLAALIFLVHPIQTQAVSYIGQRLASLASLFYLLALTFYIKGRSEKKCVSYFAVSILAAALGMFTKEIVFTLPFMILLVEAYFISEGKIEIKKRYVGLILLFLFIVPLLFSFNLQTIFGRIQHSESHAGDFISVRNYWITQFRVIGVYIKLLLVPIGQNLDYDFPASKSFFEWPTFGCAILLAALLISALKWQKKFPFISFGIFWLFITFSVESSIIPIRHVIFEHRVYLPCVGYAIILTAVLMRFLKGQKRIIVAGMVIVTLSVLTFQRNELWRTEKAMWEDVIKKSPEKSRGYLNLGIAYARERKFDIALDHFHKALELNPSSFKTYDSRGLLYAQLEEYDLALRDFNQSITIRSTNPLAYLNRGGVYYRLKRYDLAIEDSNKAIELSPNLDKAYNNRGIIYIDLKKFDLAVKDFDKALEINPTYAMAFYNRSIANYYLKQFDLALSDTLKAKSLGYPIGEDRINQIRQYVSQIRKK